VILVRAILWGVLPIENSISQKRRGNTQKLLMKVDMARMMLQRGEHLRKREGLFGMLLEC